MHNAISTAAADFDAGGTNAVVTGATAGATGKEIFDSLTTAATGAGNANNTIKNLQVAIESVSTVRSEMGAAANRLNHVYNNLANVSTNTRNATGRIMDVDFAIVEHDRQADADASRHRDAQADQGQPVKRLAFFHGWIKNFRTALNGVLETVVLYL